MASLKILKATIWGWGKVLELGMGVFNSLCFLFVLWVRTELPSQGVVVNTCIVARRFKKPCISTVWDPVFLTHLRNSSVSAPRNPTCKGRFCLLLASKELYRATVNKKQLNLLKVCKIRSNLFGDLKKTSKQKSWVIDCYISVALNLKWNQPRLGPKG